MSFNYDEYLKAKLSAEEALRLVRDTEVEAQRNAYLDAGIVPDVDPGPARAENCPRCGEALDWKQSSLYCSHCQYKEGCCG